MRYQSVLLSLSSVFLASCSLAAAEPTEPAPLRSFLAAHCYDCHAGDAAEADLDLEHLPDPAASPQAFQTWTRVFDRVQAAEMPPPADSQLADDAADDFLQQTQRRLTELQLAQQQARGRVQARRLTNLQLERTLQDLLGIDIPLERELPEAPRTGHFSTLADQQSISHFTLAQHLKVVDVALDEAFRRALGKGDTWTREMSAKQISRTRTRTREPEFIDGAAVIWSSRLAFYGRLPATTAKEAGWYRFRFQVSALKPPANGRVWCTVRSGPCVSSAPLMAWIDAFEATEEPREIVVEAWLSAGDMLEIRPGDITLKAARFAGGQSANGEGGRQNVPGIKIDWLVQERFHRGGDDAAIRQSLFGQLGLSRQQLQALAKPTSAADNPLAQQIRPLLENFARRAFRRDVAAEDLTGYEQLFQRQLQEGHDAVSALKATYRGLLCSPRFLYFQEQPGPLDDYALASRLSYFLWGSMPDATLFELAAKQRLRDPDVLAQQLDRMLADPKGKRFVSDFCSEWLELKDIGFTEPDPRMFRDFDPIVQAAMLAETHHFLQHLLDHDVGVQQLVDADFTFLNSRLARYYGIDGVTGDAMQRVAVKPNSHRGGLLAQGAILKVTANGTNTSPVLRGVWLANRVLGPPIPPPPASVPAIEPDIRGATTIREQLAKHRDHAECASCHRKIDPPGFALENFDPAGKWRENYPRIGSNKPGAKIDPSYVTADGQPFDDFDSFRKLVAADPVPIARNLASQLLAYGTGAEVSFADRQSIARLVEQTREDNFGIRSLLAGVVTSQPFLTK